MNEDCKKWLIEKIAQSPEYLSGTFIPALEKQAKFAESALQKTMRIGDLAQIKYAMGVFDGVVGMLKVVEGLKLSEGKIPTGPGLMDRMFSRMRGEATPNPD